MDNFLGLIPAERRQRILEIIRAKGTVRVSALSDLLGVSELTIRRDLENLEQEGFLERTHGGAVSNRRISLEPLFSEKHRLQLVEKDQIGAAAASRIKDGETVFIHSGSTTLHIFKHLTNKHNLRLITSNASALTEFQNLDAELILIGGVYREQSNSLVGSLAIASLQQFNASKCIIGVDGVSPKYGLTTPNLLEAEVARTMIERTRGERIVVADSSKFGKVAEVVTAPLEKIDTLIVDDSFNESLRADFEELGIQIIIAVPER